MMRTLAGLAALGAASVMTAGAVTVTVLPGNPTWANPPGENSGGGSSAITSTDPRSGNGSVELFGQRTRFVGLGNFYSPASNLGLLSDVSSFSFDWSVAVGSTTSFDPDYTPALRLHIWNAAGTQRSELIWEGAYNGTYGNTTKGTWYTSGTSDNFWQFVNGVGATEIYDRSISDWQSIYGAGAYVSGISVGVGGGAGAGYHAFADNVTLAFGANSTTYNFEASAASVPDAAGTLALLGAAFTGLVAFRRKLSV
jgi:hypothetical protein